MNPLHYVHVEHLSVVNDRTVVFSVDLSKHVHLIDPTVVESGMNRYLAQFGGRMETWRAEAAQGWLHITVVGTINWPNRLDINL